MKILAIGGVWMAVSGLASYFLGRFIGLHLSDEDARIEKERNARS